MKKLVLFVLAILVAGLVAAVIHFRPRFESAAPQVTLPANTEVLGIAPIEVTVADEGMGLKSVTAVLSAGGTEHRLLSENFNPPAAEKKFTFAPAKLPGLKEGEAVLRVTARDASLRNSFGGNETVFEKKLTIDATPPTIGLVADDRYVNFGGVGAIVYTASPDTVATGVKMGARFFPGFKGVIEADPARYFVLFAHPYDAPPNAKAILVAIDKAGNTREMPLAYELKGVKYRKSTIPLTDAFLQNKVAPLLTDVATRQGSPKDVFVAVNKGMRKQNEDKIREITSKATPTMLWKGAFSQLSNSKVEANFADERTYVYNKESIDTAYHLGYDLSVTKQYPVEAANGGKVAFTGDLGIYGNTVILDHGLGLFTLYSHLSSIDVKVGDAIQARQPLGRTGETGLAAGDHLHYGVYLHGLAVLPVEWWDAKWIRDNVEPKLEGRGGQEIAEAQQPSRSPRKGTGRRAR